MWACDFLQTYDILFRPIFACFIIEVGSRKGVQVGVTRSPPQAWAAQQRLHQGIGQRVPAGPANDSAVAKGRVIARPVLGGLPDDYRRAT